MWRKLMVQVWLCLMLFSLFVTCGTNFQIKRLQHNWKRVALIQKTQKWHVPKLFNKTLVKKLTTYEGAYLPLF
jgi:hypothetical protein